MGSEFVHTLQAEFERLANPKIAHEQAAYMKHLFEFYGLKAPVRREIQRPFLLKNYLPPKQNLETLVKQLWRKPQREFQMVGQELVAKYKHTLEENDMGMLEYMITNKSWWDTVDFIASNLVGAYFLQYPHLRKAYVRKWLESNNMWLQRSALLFQLNYKNELDTKLLESAIEPLLGSKEFFINKAIGWILRQYSKTNPDWVVAYVKRTPLQPLSRREALRLL
jgi:3-methyladenine DNA glycosylase AlkD